MSPGEESPEPVTQASSAAASGASRRDVTSRTAVKKIHWSTSGGGYAPPS